jgi:hypothetical protein
MKLHLGCGRQYIPGAINVDRYDLTVADIKADAGFLPLPSGCAETLFTHHLLEHQRYAEAVYGLAECFRVFRPDGLLEIETPDADASFRAFLESKDDGQRAAALTWIFGEDVAGQGHRALFPRKLLLKMVVEAGFDRIAFSEPRTHLHRQGIRLIALKNDSNIGSKTLSLLRPAIAFDVVSTATPQEMLELENSLWRSLRRCQAETLRHDDKVKQLLRISVIAPQVVAKMVALGRLDRSLVAFCDDHTLSKLGDAACALSEAEICAVLREAFSGLCSGVNQTGDGYEHLMNAACFVCRKWLSTPPKEPRQALLKELEALEITLRPKPDDGFIRDYDIASGREPIDGRKPVWPKHNLFTREHLVERARWFRDMGIRCFGLGEHEQARRLFRLAINSKVEGFYSVWNMARLQAVLGNIANAERFYRASLEFPIPLQLKQRIQTELEACTTASSRKWGPVSVGEGLDRVALDVQPTQNGEKNER